MENQNNNPQYGAPQGNPQYDNPQYGAPQGNPQYDNPQYGAPQAAPQAKPVPKVNKIVSIISIIVIVISLVVIMTVLNGPKITKAEYNEIEVGMTYNEVCDIIGGEGELQASYGGAAIYSWEGVGTTGANAAITFYNGRVTGKAQAGLN